MLKHLQEIKQTSDNLLKLQESTGIIRIDSDGEILIMENAFKEMAIDNKYVVKRGLSDKSVLFYQTEIDGCVFKTNSTKPLFEDDLQLLQEQKRK